MSNPLDAEINLSNISLVVREKNKPHSDTIGDLVDVEVIKEVTLGPKESISVRSYSSN